MHLLQARIFGILDLVVFGKVIKQSSFSLILSLTFIKLMLKVKSLNLIYIE
jgi:hypothetical protein